VLPLLYLHGLSSSDFAPALGQFCGSTAGLVPATITRLTAQWRDDAAAFNQRSLAETDYVYIWVDGIHLKVRLEQDKVSLLVMIGVRADGRKELIALVDVFRESSEVLGRSAARLQTTRHDRAGARRRRRCARVLEGGTRGVPRNQGAALLVPRHRERLAAPLMSAHPGAKAALTEIWNAEDRDPRPHGRESVRRCLRGQMAQGDSEDHRRWRASSSSQPKGAGAP